MSASRTHRLTHFIERVIEELDVYLPHESDNGEAQWEQLRTATKAPLSKDQALVWVTALIDLVTERWATGEAALDPSWFKGLETARAAIAFLKTEKTEREDWWDEPPIEIEALENYLCSALGGIIEYENQIASIEKSHEAYDCQQDHADDECEVCRQRWAYQDAYYSEFRGTLRSMIMRAYEAATAPQGVP